MSMDKNQVPISELPFNFDGLESQYGQIKYAELICPGVYYIGTKLNIDRPRFAGEYLVVTGFSRNLPGGEGLYYSAADHS